MEAKSILTADLLDILFENRNKEYGAYQLRKTYNKRIRLALGSIFIVCILLGVITFFHQPPKTSEHQSLFVKDYQLAAIHDIQKEAIRLPPVARTVHQVAMARVTIPLIVRNVDVNPEDEPPINDQLDKIKIGIENNAGWGENNVPLPLEKSSTTMDIVTTRKNYDTQVFTVQVEAKFPGELMHGPAIFKEICVPKCQLKTVPRQAVTPSLFLFWLIKTAIFRRCVR